MRCDGGDHHHGSPAGRYNCPLGPHNGVSVGRGRRLLASGLLVSLEVQALRTVRIQNATQERNHPAVRDGFRALVEFPAALSGLLVGIAWGLLGGSYDILLSDCGVRLLHGGGWGLSALYATDGLGVLLGTWLGRIIRDTLCPEPYMDIRHALALVDADGERPHHCMGYDIALGNGSRSSAQPNFQPPYRNLRYGRPCVPGADGPRYGLDGTARGGGSLRYRLHSDWGHLVVDSGAPLAARERRRLGVDRLHGPAKRMAAQAR